MTQYRILPNYPVPLSQGGATQASWYRFWNDINQGTPSSQELTLTPTGSPFTYQATQGGFLVVSGGTISSIVFTRVGSYTLGTVAGAFPMAAGDQITVSYSMVPTIVFAPC